MKLTTAIAVLAVTSSLTAKAFVPHRPAHLSTSTTSAPLMRVAPSNSRLSKVSTRSSSNTRLQMSAEDFDQTKYTEAAWACMAALSGAGDYYQAQMLEAPLLLDVLLNPNKHSAGEDALAARKVVESALGKAGADVKKLRSDLEQYLAGQAKNQAAVGTQKTIGNSLAKVLTAARSNMAVLGDSFVATEGLLLALAKEDTNFTTKALLKQDVTYTKILDAIKGMRETQGPVISRSAENMYEALSKYGIDFTERAAQGKLDPVIGRDDEIRRAIQILSRRTK